MPCGPCCSRCFYQLSGDDSHSDFDRAGLDELMERESVCGQVASMPMPLLGSVG